MQVKLTRCVIFTIILTFEAYFFSEKVTSHCSLPHFVTLPVSWTVEKCKKVAKKLHKMSAFSSYVRALLSARMVNWHSYAIAVFMLLSFS